MLMNTSLSLSPQTSFEGPTLTFDFPDLHIGIAEYQEGCTVFYFLDEVATAIDACVGLVAKAGGSELCIQRRTLASCSVLKWRWEAN